MTRAVPSEVDGTATVTGLAMEDIVYLNKGLDYLSETTMQAAMMAAAKGDDKFAEEAMARSDDIEALQDKLTVALESLGCFYDEHGFVMKKVEEVA